MDYKVEHIGIAVKDLATSIPLFEQLLGSPCYKTETVASEAVNTAFFLQQSTKIELLESSDPGGPIAKFIDKKGEVVTAQKGYTKKDASQLAAQKAIEILGI